MKERHRASTSTFSRAGGRGVALKGHNWPTRVLRVAACTVAVIATDDQVQIAVLYVKSHMKLWSQWSATDLSLRCPVDDRDPSCKAFHHNQRRTLRQRQDRDHPMPSSNRCKPCKPSTRRLSCSSRVEIIISSSSSTPSPSSCSKVPVPVRFCLLLESVGNCGRMCV